MWIELGLQRWVSVTYDDEVSLQDPIVGDLAMVSDLCGKLVVST